MDHPQLERLREGQYIRDIASNRRWLIKAARPKTITLTDDTGVTNVHPRAWVGQHFTTEGRAAQYTLYGFGHIARKHDDETELGTVSDLLAAISRARNANAWEKVQIMDGQGLLIYVITD